MTFSAEALGRREPYDRRARNQAVLAAVAESFASCPALTIVDLACGTGATLRAVSGALPRRQTWRLVDNDLSLLARAQWPPSADVTVRATPLDLMHDLEAALDGPVDLVTTSVFLDLVSLEWIERLVTEIAARRLCLYAALSFDGRIAMSPADSFDPVVVDAFCQHQRTDKGFGPALGPSAAAEAIGLFKRVGYSVAQGTADWVLTTADHLQAEVCAELGMAAFDMGVAKSAIDQWTARRMAMIAREQATLRMGHTDFFATPTGRR